MEHNIGVGVIVGLTFASSVFVWSSDNFNKAQKTGLLICAIFPPAQWIGILIALVYNNYRSNNTIEKIQERKTEETKTKLNSSISDLKELKQKGLISEQEYKTKVNRIEAEKEGQDLKNSTEYKQLKSLFENSILTKEEFENKVELLKNFSESAEPIKEDIQEIINSANKVYFESIKEQPIKTINENKKSSTNDTAYIVLFVSLILIGMIIFIIYRNEIIPSPITYENDTYPTYEESDYGPIYQEPQKIKKFAYIVIKVKKPVLDVFQPMSYTDAIGFYIVPDPIYTINYENETYSTEIIEIENYNEDEKYRAIDKAKGDMLSQLMWYDSAYSRNLLANCKDAEKREEFKKITSKIEDTQIYPFDSYSEASIHKQDNLEQ